jgi:hypothetical protein
MAEFEKEGFFDYAHTFEDEQPTRVKPGTPVSDQEVGAGAR